ncbi:2-succinyl-5-enolpyruvyl-6-hydroxy-3-cyclohexene-1-carboxylic-acid synthase [Actomonas aquatica]|uniref:2-succinyl-5-enolpyruvyl-6-hydroxy-3-cyclohexene-1-carboxylate synthase n=1 Tax=Actomonas aquatica TaxID=2866162 RepID=A0ABZ1C916_9BACT|nr:2-succinyl-5-enolpyruvyl-6-hydroxy-3-cyclohexene-1-carboxylic-acid synthase [Opitutus sp. WL0086]WRQ88183.1 2-succinyl-5-enolpyruvyl-6-hydroxy-3-cyclohexene-1-carboxylic-acid synthase [Opitutus sp. WL0086]
MSPLDFRNPNSLWSSVLVETLVRCGLRTAVVSPGSRSTPLTMALAAHPAVDAVPVLDERCAGFFALGQARAQHRPVVLVCTSGSAAAHYLPAVIEAHESGVPLIVLSADRPPEMRDCASGQTIDQHKLFGRYATWYHELAVPEPRLELLRYLRQTLRQAWTRASAGGVVQLNAPFRDPLPPLPDDGATAALAESIDDTFWAQPEAPALRPAGLVLHQRGTPSRGVIVAGPAQPADQAAYVEAIANIARQTGWPILADALSPLRHYAPDDVCVVSAYHGILRNERLARELTPRMVIAFEAWPTSKELRAWLEQSQAEMLMLSERAGSHDAMHGKTREIQAPATALVIDGRPPVDPSWAAAWREAEERMRAAFDGWFGETRDTLFEGEVTWRVAQALPDGAQMCVANSMPVRDLEYFWPASARGRRVFFSRGANGIDGTLSTALGVAHGVTAPTVLLTGDLAFLHDSNGLQIAHELKGSLTVIVINNDGGGIFGHLPVAQFEPPFERYFSTPPQLDLAALCAGHRVAHRLIADGAELSAALSALPAAGMQVLEVRTDRRADVATRKRLFRELPRQLD